MTHQTFQAFHEIETGELSDNSVIFVPCQQVTFDTIGSLEVGPNSIGNSLDFGFFVEDDGTGGMESDGIPD